MFNKKVIAMTMKLSRCDAGLARSKICARAVHHLFRLKMDLATEGEEEENEARPP